MWKLQWYVVEAVIQPPAGCCLPPAYPSSLAISGHVLACRDMLCYAIAKCMIRLACTADLDGSRRLGTIKPTEAVSDPSNGKVKCGEDDQGESGHECLNGGGWKMENVQGGMQR
jgi:hypothetical protein